MEGIDRYFDILSNPRVKYKNAKDSKMYDYIFPVVGEVNQENWNNAETGLNSIFLICRIWHRYFRQELP